MPDKQLHVAAYAAGASLAAITLVYVFAPTFFMDGDSAMNTTSRKRSVIGLSNPANDCFINSVLQSLTGLGELRVYLAREKLRLARDQLEGERPRPHTIEEEKALDLQNEIVTQGLKDMLDALNERPIYKKTISAGAFISHLEKAFRQRISRQQQDAQEFLQVVTERMGEEYAAARKLRRKRRRAQLGAPMDALTNGISKLSAVQESDVASNLEEREKVERIVATDAEEELENHDDNDDENDEDFPFEGKMESQVECETCHFKPKPTISAFLSLTLHVPETSTTLNSCFDKVFQTEYIDDYICDKCRLEHAIAVRAAELSKTSGAEKLAQLSSDLSKLKEAFEKDPEVMPKGVELPDSKTAPKRRISRATRISEFPRILLIHLSRSVFSQHYSSTKNMAKVNFPERLPLGGLLNQKTYKLLGVVTHKGTHNSGHYESFRRQNLYMPFSTPNNLNPGGAFSQNGSPIGTPNLRATSLDVPRSSIDQISARAPSPLGHKTKTGDEEISPSSSLPSLSPSTSSLSSQSTRPASNSVSGRIPLNSTLTSPSDSRLSISNETPLAVSPPSSPEKTKRSSSILSRPSTTISLHRPSALRKRGKKEDNRWWRVSDEKIKDCKTSDVLGMQKEVYLLFYEVERPLQEDEANLGEQRHPLDQGEKSVVDLMST
jgi:ubiquitin carboxyl-terminal hydrolase 16